jgi:hypothetical protein
MAWVEKTRDDWHDVDPPKSIAAKHECEKQQHIHQSWR